MVALPDKQSLVDDGGCVMTCPRYVRAFVCTTESTNPCLWLLNAEVSVLPYYSSAITEVENKLKHRRRVR